MKWADHRGGWRKHKKLFKVGFSLRRWNGTASPGTWLRAHSRLRACSLRASPPAAACSLLRIISFARTHPRPSRLPHCQAPGHVHIRITVRASARGPADGYFTRADTSAAVLGAYSSKSGVPGCVFAPLSATGLGFGNVGTTPENILI
jgi:hypothetical protein